MVKCTNENKCVPQNTPQFCFMSFDSGCQGDLPY